MGTLLSAADWPIVGQIAWLLGEIMNFIYVTLGNIFSTEHGLVGWSIIIYTIIVYTLMLPFTIKQQKTARMSSVMSPELQAIQKKYRNKKDQDSMMKQQEEMRQVYDKYGTSMAGGCLPLLIQMPLLFALYPVIYDMERYVPAIKDAGEGVYKFFTIPNLSMSPMEMITKSSSFDAAPAVVIITAIALPLLSAATQYGSIKLSQVISGRELDKDNPMAGTMKTMNLTMPIFSIFMVFTLSSGIGLYWIVSAVVRCVQQLAINRYLKSISVEDLIEKNREKAEKKRKKRGEKAEKINQMAQTNTKRLSSAAKQSTLTEAERDEKLKKAEENRNSAKAGSLASKANMVKKFNENN